MNTGNKMTIKEKIDIHNLTLRTFTKEEIMQCIEVLNIHDVLLLDNISDNDKLDIINSLSITNLKFSNNYCNYTTIINMTDESIDKVLDRVYLITNDADIRFALLRGICNNSKILLSNKIIEKYYDNRFDIERFLDCTTKINFSREFILKIIDQYSEDEDFRDHIIAFISTTNTMDLDLISKYKDVVYWNSVCKLNKLTEEFMEEHIDYIDNSTTALFQELSDEFIENHINRLDRNVLYRLGRLNKPFINSFEDKVTLGLKYQYNSMNDMNKFEKK